MSCRASANGPHDEASAFASLSQGMGAAAHVASRRKPASDGASGTPWVGARESGYGYHSGRDGHRQFTQVRVVSLTVDED